MNRTKAVAYRLQVLGEAQRQLKLVEDVPENTLIKFKIRSYIHDDHDTSGWGYTQVIGKLALFNNTSFRVRTYAAEKRSYPFSHDLRTIIGDKDYPENFGLHPLRFQAIHGWEIVPETDLPLYVGWAVIYPIFSETFKEIKHA